MAGSWAPFGSTSEPPEEEPQAAAPAAAPAPGPDAAYLPREPARQLAIVTCMDSRIDPLPDLGLRRGDAMVLRNAGATVSDDVERSLRLVTERLGVTEVWLVGHTDCAAHDGADGAAKSELLRGVPRVRNAAPGVTLRLLFLDLATGAVAPVEPPG
jgi:carbonic anhydrase